MLLTTLGPIDQLRAGRLPRRLVQLVVGLWLYGVSIGFMLRGRLGQAPWDALHVGLAHHLGVDVGDVLIGVSFVVLLLWIPLREVPGLGTLANAVLIGVATNVTLDVLGTPSALWLRLVLALGGVLLCGVASALYIGAQLGRGPRDGLMTGVQRITGLSMRLVRTGLEVVVLVVGLLLGGSFGITTVVFALTIGPITQALLPLALVRLDDSLS